MPTFTHRFVGVLIAGMLTTGCGLDNPEAPSLIGPSEFALAVTMAASPDVLPRDGTSRSTVTFVVRDAAGRPVSGQRLSISANGPTGAQISASEVTTNSNGEATATVTAPPATGVGPDVITVFATPIGTNFDNSATRSLSIALTGQSNTSAPNAAFQFTPAAPEVRQMVTFDAGSSSDDGRTCGTSCTYTWDFGDGTSGSGIRATKAFNSAGSFQVALTVRDPVGLTSTTRQTVVVSVPTAPTATLAVNPDPPLLGQQATFSATAAAATNHSIVRYDWNFGDGTTATTTSPTVTKTYNSPGTYVATVTVTDDLGTTGAASKNFTVGSGITVAFTSSPTNPRPNDRVNFNATGTTSSAGATITNYSWDFGDGTTASGSSPTASHVYTAARTYVVRLTVTDSLGRTSTTTNTVTVSTS